MSHFELFRCDGMVDMRTPDNMIQPYADDNYQVKCSSVLEVADTFPTILIERLLAADWLTIHTVGKGDRHYCPIHKAVAA